MDTKGSRTHRLVRWLKDKIEKRQNDRDDHDPWWVTLMLDVGRPVVAIMILTMCAPGEHYLMLEARFVDPFAWLGPGTLTAYAGIAAVTATKRPKGSPGHRTAVTGAVIAIGLAMAAQPIAHLWGIKGLDLQKIILICVVSSVPSAVFGHLLHMGAAPTNRRRTARPDRKPDKDKSRTPDRKPKWMTDNETAAASAGVSVSELMSAPDSPPDMATWTGHADTDASNRPAVRSIKSGSLSADVRAYLSENPDTVAAYLSGQTSDADAKLSAAIKLVRPEAAWDSVRKARDRFLDKEGRTA